MDNKINIIIKVKNDGSIEIEKFGKDVSKTMASAGQAAAKSAKETQSAWQNVHKSFNVISKGIGGSLTSLKSGFKGIGLSIITLNQGIELAGRVIGGFSRTIGSFTQAYNQQESALIGLSSVTKAFGQDIDAAKKAAINLSKDGLMSIGESALAIKNLLAYGLNLPKTITLLRATKELAIFNRQAFYTTGEALVAFSEGLKNNNMIMADAAGATKNASVMLKEYADAHEKSVASLTQGEIREAVFLGYLKEAQRSAGDLDKGLETLVGQQSKYIGLLEKTKAKIGEAFGPYLGIILKEVNKNLEGFLENIETNFDAYQKKMKGFLIDFVVLVKGSIAAITPLVQTGLLVAKGFGIIAALKNQIELNAYNKEIKDIIKYDSYIPAYKGETQAQALARLTKERNTQLEQFTQAKDALNAISQAQKLVSSGEQKTFSLIDKMIEKIKNTKIEKETKTMSKDKTGFIGTGDSIGTTASADKKNEKEEIIRAIPWETGIQYKKSLEERRKLFAPAWASELGTYDEEFFKTTSSEQRALMIQNRKSEFLKIRNQRLFGKNLETVFQGWFFDVPEAMAEKAIKDAESKSRTRRSIQARKPQLYQDFQQLFQGAFVDAPKAMSEQWLENIHKIAPEWETTMQSMKQASEDTTHDIYYGFKNIFTAGLKGDMQGIKGAWQNMLAEMQNEWLNAMAKMAVNKLFKNLVPSLFNSLGFGDGGGAPIEVKSSTAVNFISSNIGSGGMTGIGTGGAGMSTFGSAPRYVPRFANGGYIDKPTLSILGEIPEAVIPMKNYKIPVEIINRKSSGSSSATDSINQRPIFITPIYIIANDGNSVKNMFDKNPNLIASHLLHATRYNSAVRKQIASI